MPSDPTDQDLERGMAVATGEYPLTHDLCTCEQYPKMRCRICRDRRALAEEIATLLADTRERCESKADEAVGFLQRVALDTGDAISIAAAHGAEAVAAAIRGSK